MSELMYIILQQGTVPNIRVESALQRTLGSGVMTPKLTVDEQQCKFVLIPHRQ